MREQPYKELYTSKPHHAYFIAAHSIPEATADLLETIANAFSIKTQGNPDVAAFEYETVGIDDARLLKEWATRSPFTGQKKFCIISAHAFTTEAQNALLKTLEEPTLGTHFFIVTHRRGTLLPTVLSRMTELSTDRDTSKNTEGELFVKSTLPERLKQVKNIVDQISNEERSKSDADALLNAIEIAIAPRVTRREEAYVLFADQLLRAKRDLAGRSPSIKIILEHIALIAP